jgi:nicotinamidase-related amidase
MASHGTPISEFWSDVKAPENAPQLHAITIDAKKTALLLLDFLRDVCTEKERPRAAAALPKLQSFLQKARDRGMLIAHTTTHKGSPNGSDLAEAVRPIAGERVFTAPFNKFHKSDLERHLKSQGIGTVIVAGTSPNNCVMFTTAGAVLLGFRAIVPIDGMPGLSPYQEQFVAWQLVNGSGFRETTTLSRLDMISFGK